VSHAPKKRRIAGSTAARIGGVAGLAAGAFALALAPAGIAGALPGPGRGGPGPGSPGSPPSQCPPAQGTTLQPEALLAYNAQEYSSLPMLSPGATITLYYEDGTRYCQSSLVITGPGGKDTITPKATELYAASSGQPSSDEANLLGELNAVDPSLRGSPPNAANNQLSGEGGEDGYDIPYVDELTFMVPSNLSAGSYSATLTVDDSDGNYDSHSWSFNVSETNTPVGAVGGLGVAAVLGGGLLLVQGNRRRRRATTTA